MTSTRLPSLLAASAKSSSADQKRAKDDLLAWRTVENMIRSLNEQSKGVTWPPPVASYGSWPHEHVAAAMLRVLLTAHGTRTHLVAAQELLETHHELDRWLSRARLYPVLSTILVRFDQQKKSDQPTTFATLTKVEVVRGRPM